MAVRGKCSGRAKSKGKTKGVFLFRATTNHTSHYNYRLLTKKRAHAAAPLRVKVKASSAVKPFQPFLVLCGGE